MGHNKPWHSISEKVMIKLTNEYAISHSKAKMNQWCYLTITTPFFLIIACFNLMKIFKLQVKIRVNLQNQNNQNNLKEGAQTYIANADISRTPLASQTKNWKFQNTIRLALYQTKTVFMEQPAITSDEALEENKIQKYLIIPAVTNKECNKNLFTKISG